MIRINNSAPKRGRKYDRKEYVGGPNGRGPNGGVRFAPPVLILLLSLVLFISATGCSRTQPEAVTANDFALGTTCSVKLYGLQNRKYLQPALDIAKKVEQNMSVHLKESEISRINAAAGESSLNVSKETFALLLRAREFSAIGDGVFDLTIGPLVSLWDIGSGNETVPGENAIAAALELVDYTDVVFGPEGNYVGLKRNGMNIDLGAIAKGYAADKMVDYLRASDVPSGIINLGGNVYAFGEKPGGGPWKIGIQSPSDDRGKYIGVVETGSSAVVTSGKYERYFVADGIRYHHILNTDNGYPVENGVASVSIVSRDATAADALSTLVFALGLEEGLRLSEEMAGVEAIIVTEDNTVYTTSGLRDSFKLSDKGFDRGESKHILE